VRILQAVMAVLFLVGIVFAGQGLGLIPGSYMTGRSEWAAIGGLMAAAALLGLWWLARPKP
jgi:hypothetical protein